jgi:hypothetical protein
VTDMIFQRARGKAQRPLTTIPSYVERSCQRETRYDELHNIDGNQYTVDPEQYGHDGCKYNRWSEWFHGTPWRWSQWIQWEPNRVEWTPDTHSHLYLSGEDSQAALSAVPGEQQIGHPGQGQQMGQVRQGKTGPRDPFAEYKRDYLALGPEFHADMSLMDYCSIRY